MSILNNKGLFQFGKNSKNVTPSDTEDNNLDVATIRIELRMFTINNVNIPIASRRENLEILQEFVDNYHLHLNGIDEYIDEIKSLLYNLEFGWSRDDYFYYRYTLQNCFRPSPHVEEPLNKIIEILELG